MQSVYKLSFTMNSWAGVFATVILSFLFAKTEASYENNRPVIGVLSQELLSELKNRFPGYKSYIAGSYVKALQASGARVVPIMTGQDEGYYRALVKQLNGVLYPGGFSSFSTRGGYADAGEIIYKLAIQVNNDGDYFPMFGVCLGLLFFMFVSSNNLMLSTDCHSVNDTLPLEFKPDFRYSHLFENVPDDVVNMLQSEPVTYNWHTGCITEQNMTRFALDKLWKVLALNKDINNLEFISIAEMRDYPIFALQFHPEKNAYEWNKERNIPHSFNAIYSARYFYDYFVNQARQNSHTYPEELELHDLIDNYEPVFTGKYKEMGFDQVYLFK